MNKLLASLAVCLFVCHAAYAANFEREDEALIGWHYTYEAISQGHKVPIYFSLRQCKSPTLVAAQGYSPLPQCFKTEADARIEAQKWADTEEIRYRDVQNPAPNPIDAAKRLWQKTINYFSPANRP